MNTSRTVSLSDNEVVAKQINDYTFLIGGKTYVDTEMLAALTRCLTQCDSEIDIPVNKTQVVPPQQPSVFSVNQCVSKILALPLDDQPLFNNTQDNLLVDKVVGNNKAEIVVPEIIIDSPQQSVVSVVSSITTPLLVRQESADEIVNSLDDSISSSIVVVPETESKQQTSSVMSLSETLQKSKLPRYNPNIVHKKFSPGKPHVKPLVLEGRVDKPSPTKKVDQSPKVVRQPLVTTDKPLTRNVSVFQKPVVSPFFPQKPVGNPPNPASPFPHITL